jgi:hypothetical protein
MGHLALWVGKDLHKKISSKSLIEQFMPSVGNISNSKKRVTKQTKGHFKNIRHKMLTGHLTKPENK